MLSFFKNKHTVNSDGVYFYSHKGYNKMGKTVESSFLLLFIKYDFGSEYDNTVFLKIFSKKISPDSKIFNQFYQQATSEDDNVKLNDEDTRIDTFYEEGNKISFEVRGDFLNKIRFKGILGHSSITFRIDAIILDLTSGEREETIHQSAKFDFFRINS